MIEACKKQAQNKSYFILHSTCCITLSEDEHADDITANSVIVEILLYLLLLAA
jgi:hypothetical protein